MKILSIALVSLSAGLSFQLSANVNNINDGGTEVVVPLGTQKSDKDLIAEIKSMSSLASKLINSAGELTNSYKAALSSAQRLHGYCNALADQSLQLAVFQEAYQSTCELSLKQLENIAQDVLEVVTTLPAEVKTNSLIVEQADLILETLQARLQSKNAFSGTLQLLEDYQISQANLNNAKAK